MNKEEIESELKKMNPDFFTTTTHAEFSWQPMEPINMDTSFRKRKNEFSIYVDASFQGGVFKLPLIDPPKFRRSQYIDHVFQTEYQNNDTSK